MQITNIIVAAFAATATATSCPTRPLRTRNLHTRKTTPSDMSAARAEEACTLVSTAVTAIMAAVEWTPPSAGATDAELWAAQDAVDGFWDSIADALDAAQEHIDHMWDYTGSKLDAKQEVIDALWDAKDSAEAGSEVVEEAGQEVSQE